MSDRYIEKTFIYLVLLSLLMHTGAFVLFYLRPEEKPAFRQEPLMVDLQEQPQGSSPPGKQQAEARRLAETRRRVAKEMAPKGERERDKLAPPPTAARPVPPKPQQPVQKGGGEISTQPQATAPGPRMKQRPGESILKPKGAEVPELSKLFPSAEKLARLEESYRKKYESEVEAGETKFLNTDDIQFGSFLRRFETAVYGVWRYPADAARLGIEGVTPVRITFNRQGEIIGVELLNSSGSKILDEEVLRTLKQIGPVGGFPKGFDKNEFNLIAFFQYGIIRGSSRGMLH